VPGQPLERADEDSSILGAPKRNAALPQTSIEVNPKPQLRPNHTNLLHESAFASLQVLASALLCLPRTEQGLGRRRRHREDTS